MAFDTKLADRIREFSFNFEQLKVEESKMFSGLSFLVNGKMCINVSGDNLMCRFDSELHEEISKRKGFLKMIMRGKEYKGYHYVEPIGFKVKEDFEYCVKLCLNYNERAKASKKKK